VKKAIQERRFFQAGAVEHHQRFPNDFAKRFTFADELKRDSAEEGRVITAEFAHFHMVTVYTPNAKDDLSRLPLRHKHWDPAFLAYCKQLEKSKPVIFCGDLNVAHTELDLANPKPNRGKKGFTDEERAGFQAFLDAGFVDTFRLFTQGNGHYSWWSHFANSRARNVGWRIDYLMVSSTLARRGQECSNPPESHGQRSLPGEHHAGFEFLERFQDGRNALAAADALRREGVAAARAGEQGCGLAGNARARCTQRMAERHTARRPD